ncbi:hypothetical protein SAMN06265371_101531 [Lutibacter agarilyticus]|uniref:DUF2147 domain-containing protein n=1 Tax=Lutibacter agarilyticus TaxID=1109740 RepID=A0A238VJ90_9FLAO|nr:DUF2147 domain-containing protein [Lutibacter agarilyticus]SNR34460.1 hypothetical protein SAMN06265371_101531 [Lutibacter agarilyticus]
MMKNLKLLIIGFALIVGVNSYSQTIFGKWKTFDEETGNEKSIVEIYEQNGKAYGKILQLLEKGKENNLCDNCSGAKKGQPIKGMEIINGLTKDDDEWNDAKILDPKTGKEYKCYIVLEEDNKLKVRGYLGFSLIGRTQYWTRM